MCGEDSEENKGQVRNKIRRKRQGRKGRDRSKWYMDKGERVGMEGRREMDEGIGEIQEIRAL